MDKRDDDTSGSSLLSVSSHDFRRDADHDEGGAPRLLIMSWRGAELMRAKKEKELRNPR